MSFVYDKADVGYKTQVFYSSGNWVKPQGITMISITAIGAGGSGGTGTGLPVGNSRFGGGGGGSGAVTRLIIPEMFVTDSLVISVGTGGIGAVNGGNTTVDMVTRGNGDIYTRLIIASGGTSTTSLNAGIGGAIAVIGDALYSSMGVWTATAGVNGNAGTTTTGNLQIYANGGIPVCGGAGGAGMAAGSTVSSTGGQVLTAQPFYPTLPGGVGNTALTDGRNGPFSITPFYSMGGSGGGGGGTTPVSGGRGGNGAPGCGGGGGGAGTQPTGVGGVGGRGGDGLVIITCW
jgi:hypothetical protein